MENGICDESMVTLSDNWELCSTNSHSRSVRTKLCTTTQTNRGTGGSLDRQIIVSQL